jgi:hypothetical protein
MEDVESQAPPPKSWWASCTECWVWMGTDEATPYIEMSMFIVTFGLLWLSMDLGCQLCVFAILLLSMFFCCRFRYMFFVMWAAIGVLWIHGWRFGGGKGLSVQWN